VADVIKLLKQHNHKQPENKATT